MTFIHHFFGGNKKKGSGSGGKRARNDGDTSERAKRHARSPHTTFGNLPTDTLEHIGKLMARHDDTFKPRNLAALAGTTSSAYAMVQPIMSNKYTWVTIKLVKLMNEAKRILRLVEADDTPYHSGGKIGNFRISHLTHKHVERTAGSMRHKTTVEMDSRFEIMGIKCTVEAYLDNEEFSIEVFTVHEVRVDNHGGTELHAKEWMRAVDDKKAWLGDDPHDFAPNVDGMLKALKPCFHEAFRAFNVDGFRAKKRTVA